MRPRRNKLQREHDLGLIERLYLRGYSFRAIARELEAQHGRRLNPKTVWKEVQRLIDAYRENHALEVDRARAVELARINKLERTYWDAWEKSLLEAKRTKTSTKSGGDSTAEVQRIERLGDPRYLDGVQWCIERRCKLLGVDAPEKHEHRHQVIRIKDPEGWGEGEYEDPPELEDETVEEG